MTLPASGNLGINQIFTEFGLGVGSFRRMLGVAGAPSSGSLSARYFLGKSSADLVPDIVNWANISGSAGFSALSVSVYNSPAQSSQTIAGISQDITLRVTVPDMSMSSYWYSSAYGGSSGVADSLYLAIEVWSGSTQLTSGNFYSNTDYFDFTVSNSTSIYFKLALVVSYPSGESIESVDTSISGTVNIKNVSSSMTVIDTFTASFTYS